VSPALVDGWHWRESGAELLGTAILLFAVVTAKDWAVRRVGHLTGVSGSQAILIDNVRGSLRKSV
jgi:hypothetical protein